MKSNEEFICDVMAKAEKLEARKRKTRSTFVKVGACTLALSVVLSGALTFGSKGKASPQSTEPIVNVSSENNDLVKKGFVLVADCGFEPTKEIKSSAYGYNVSIPVGGFLDVRNTSDMTDETDKTSYDLKLKLKEIYGENGEWHITGNEGENASVYFATSGKLKLILPENNNVQKIDLACTENGKILIYDISDMAAGSIKSIKEGNNITITSDEYNEYFYESDGAFINWRPSDELYDKLFANTETDLSTVTDTITGSVTYNDGTSESFTITLNFDSEGVLHAFYGNSAM